MMIYLTRAVHYFEKTQYLQTMYYKTVTAYTNYYHGNEVSEDMFESLSRGLYDVLCAVKEVRRGTANGGGEHEGGLTEAQLKAIADEPIVEPTGSGRDFHRMRAYFVYSQMKMLMEQLTEDIDRLAYRAYIDLESEPEVEHRTWASPCIVKCRATTSLGKILSRGGVLFVARPRVQTAALNSIVSLTGQLSATWKRSDTNYVSVLSDQSEH